VPSKSQTISVYITSYNQPEYLAIAIESVLNQTRMPDQLVIIDDASTDNSQELINSYKQQHPDLFTVVLNESNQGIGEVRRRAVRATTGDLVTCLDGDDLYLPHKLELEEKALLENPTAGYAYSNFAFINNTGKQVKVWNQSPAMQSGNLFENIATAKFPFGTLPRCELFRRERLIEAMGYEKGRNLYEDLDTQLRVSRFNTVAAVHEVSHQYRMTETGLSMAAYPKHYDAIKYVFAKNRHFLQGLEPEIAKRTQQGISNILSEYAWGSVRQMAKGQIKRDKNTPASGPIYYAKAGVANRPISMLNPKRASQLIRALIRF